MEERSRIDIIKQLIILVKPLSLIMMLAVIAGLLGHLAASFISISTAYALGSYFQIINFVKIPTIFTFIFSLALLRAILRYLEQSCNHYIAFKLLAHIRDQVFAALRRLAPAKLDSKDKGDLINLITADIELLEVFYAHTISPIIIAILFAIVIVVYLLFLHWSLALVAILAYISVGILLPIFISKSNYPIGREYREKTANMASFVLESLRGLNEIFQYNCASDRLKEMSKKSEKVSLDEKKIKYLQAKSQAITNFLIIFFVLLMFVVSSYLHINKIINSFALISASMTMISSFGPFVALANLGSTLTNTFAAANRILDILQEEAVVAECKTKEHCEYKDLKVKEVSFAYDKEEILSNINIDFPDGKIIGIIGRSGSGKSTLLKLIMRFWDVDKGTITISDKNIKEIDSDNLRDMESLVSQETDIFHDSILNNILVARLGATQDEVIEACKKAQIHDYIVSLEKGYETNIAELGDSLSSGEKQRLALARAFLHNANLMLLDEPTSNLDSLNEASILKTLKDESKDKTVILVSHRQSTMKIVDIKYSVENGRMS